MTCLLERLARCRSSAVLPHDRRSERFTACAIPQDGRLALIRDTDRSDIARASADLGEYGIHRGTLAGPDLLRVVLDPTRLREVLREFLLRTGNDAAAMIEEYGPRARRSLIQRKYPATHAALRCNFSQLSTSTAASAGRCRPSLLRRQRISSAVVAHSTLTK